MDCQLSIFKADDRELMMDKGGWMMRCRFPARGTWAQCTVLRLDRLRGGEDVAASVLNTVTEGCAGGG